MRFVFYHSGINEVRTMVVDGVEECRVNLSHWPNNKTPEHLKADTSTEIALNLAKDPYGDRLFENIEIVSNNHFDTDGLLSCWTAMHPHEALRHEAFLIQAAETGDFGWFTSPEAVRFDLVISAFEDPLQSPLRSQFFALNETQKYQLLYDTLLGDMPDLLGNFGERFRDLYEEEFRKQTDAMQAVAGGAARIRELTPAGISVFEAREEFPLHVRFNACQQHRLLTFIRRDGGWLCEFTYHVVTWFETKTISKRPRIDLTALAERLNEAEGRSDACWQFDSLHAFYPRLALTDSRGALIASRLTRDLIEKHFVQFFEESERTAEDPGVVPH